VKISLHSSGLEDLGSSWYRSPGIHGSVLLDHICQRFGHYQKDKSGASISDRNRELGNAFEEIKVRQMTEKYPGEFIHNPEILCDGIYLTPDLVWLRRSADYEFKCTWMSPANGPEDLKMWKYLEQGKSYLYGLRRVMEGTALIRQACKSEEEVEWTVGDLVDAGDAYLTLYLQVCFVNDFRLKKDQIPCWKIDFWPEELSMTWASMLDEKRRHEGEVQG